MAERPFVHLHCHTHYSLLDGASRIPELVDHVKSLGMNACAMTDHGNLYGAIEFYRTCTEKGINPVVGYEAYVAPASRKSKEARRRGDAGYHLTMLAQNLTGFKNLIKLSSFAFLEGYHYVPRIDKELLEAHSEGVICLSGCASSEFSEFILAEKRDEAQKVAEWFHRVFKDRFFIEIQNNGLDIQKICADGAIDIANRMGLPLVATCDAHYLTQKDAGAHEVLLCINTGKTLNDENRMRYGSDQFYIKPPAEMYANFPGHAEAVKRSQEIADSCSLKIDMKARHFPVFLPPSGLSPEDYLRKRCAEGIKDRYGDNPSAAVMARLEHELGIIIRMGFASYFLIVADFVRFAVEKKIPCTARGSGCGSLVCFVLRVSHVDPLEYDLLFERFLDPNRSEAPDIDIDFCQDRRESVIQYVREKYGNESVAQIATFGTMAARQAIKDVGRAMDVPLQRVIQLVEMIPERLGISLEEALAENADLRRLKETDAEVDRLLNFAITLEGTNRQTGIHAAGVVISNGPLINFVPLHRATKKGDDSGSKQGEATVATQWVMGDLEKVGLLKMDFLGLRTLTLIDNAVAMIEKTRGVRVKIDKLPLDDPETYDLLQKGDAKGVFQLESDGIRELLKRLRPDNIRDIIALMALYRPGPLEGGMVDDYVNVKHGRQKPEYVHPVMKDVLEETYGVLVYQEQIMRILNRLGGIPLGPAYATIKAISKKKEKEIAAGKAAFVDGAQKQGADAGTATEIFELIEKFARYGFNKSHTAAYAQLGYQTAYLKRHFTAEFMAALLSSEIDDSNKRDIMVDHIADARKLGVAVLAPNINLSESDFSVQEGRIVFGLAAIKGVGRQATDAIVAARNAGTPFRDLFDFCERVDTKLVKAAAIERLIKSGAFDGFGAHRARLLAGLPRAVQAASDRQNDVRVGQKSLWDASPEPAAASAPGGGGTETLPEAEPWSEGDKLKYEKEVLDFYFSSHPMAQLENEIRKYRTHKIDELRGVPADSEVTLGGMLTQVRIMTYKKPQRNGNSRYGRCKIEDFGGIIESVMWGDEFVKGKDNFVADKVFLIRGKVEKKTDEPCLQITRIFTVDEARQELATGLHLLFKLLEHNSPLDIDHLATILKKTPGTCPVILTMRDAKKRDCILRLGHEFRVNPATYAHEELVEFLGAGAVMLR